MTTYQTLEGHPGLPILLEDNSIDYQKSKVQLYLVLEAIEGQSLGRFVKKNGGLSVDLAVTCILAILDIVERCHVDGVAHRDLKPDNVMLCDKNPTTPVVVDFGLSFNDFDDEIVDLTFTGEEIGNRFLRLPEDRTDHNRISDVTQLAGLFLYLLTAVEPYLLTDQHGLAPHQREKQVQILNALPLDGRHLRRLQSLFDKAFRIPAADRFQSISELRVAIKGVTEPVSDETDDEALMMHLDEIANEPDNVEAARNYEKLKKYVDHARSVMTESANERTLKSSWGGWIDRPGHIQMALMKQLDTPSPVYVQFRFELRGGPEVILVVDEQEDAWRGTEPTDPSVRSAVRRELTKSFVNSIRDSQLT